ncbi:asparaginase [Pseudarthrobacter sp. HLT3-5]|uniref:asparaginase n=1 Tax=Pseudarthrobacter cellobiosi TaxID=2953654 RepID=UPI00208E77F4|nr:asparaginase [Pseudarthrobacter sp. HLT3-5]MCO4273264.1 asparaginase [Pseudarthrobacter sp. HLT3-5]
MTVTELAGPHVVLLATGGTISSRVSEAGGAVASDTGEQVFSSVGVQASYPVRVVDVFRKGSYLLTVDDMIAVCASIRQALADPQALGIVVTHGTDTMEETAYLVDLTHDDPRPVVFTGAQEAADSQTPDGPGNLSRAIAVAGSPQARGKGVLLAFAGTIFPVAGVRKSHTTRLDAFANPDFGTAGSVSGSGAVSMHAAQHGIAPLPLPGVGAGSPRVDLIAVYPGADSKLLRASLQAGAAGVVLQGTGTGNANRALCRDVADATEAGVVVVTSTRVEAGAVVPRYGDGGGEDLRAAGAIPSGLLRPSQSLILLSLLLRLDTPKARIEEIFARRGKLPDRSPENRT